jgi:CRP/FNR family cyclic AMP-dependent transcriptional regulator
MPAISKAVCDPRHTGSIKILLTSLKTYNMIKIAMMDLNTISLLHGVSGQTKIDAAMFFGATHLIAKDKVIITPSAQDNNVYFLQSGRVRLSLISENGVLISYRDIGPGDYFGWLSAIDGGPRATAAVAFIDTVLWPMTQDNFYRLLQLDDRIFENFLKRVGNTLRAYTARIEALTTMPAQARIEQELARRFSASEVNAIDLASHEDFASWVGATRETVTRTLRSLEDAGFIQKDRQSYKLLKPFYEETELIDG